MKKGKVKMRCLLKNATIVDRDGERVKVHVLTEDNKILKVSRENLNIPAMEYDLNGYTLMPGFINTHVHLMDCFDGFNNDKLKKWLLSGITYLRDEGILSRHDTHDAVMWRENTKKSCVYPSIAICGKFISAVNGYGGVAPIGITSEAEARDAVEMQINAGIDHIKIALDEGYDNYTQSLSLLPLNILAAICDQTHKHGKKVSAHVNRSDKLEILLKAGIDEAAHACFDRIPDASLEYMVKNKVYMTPTLSVYGEITTKWGAPFLYSAMDNTKRFVDMGGVIGLGNDYIEEKEIWSPVGMPIMEIELLLKAGLTINQVISAATVGGAKILDLEAYGKIEEHCIADLIAVKGNPYELPFLLSSVNFIMKDGIVIKNVV
jgi:imidazolonepropionase-like amidohydrolase